MVDPQRENIILNYIESLKERNSNIQNREIFYLMCNHPKQKFSDQEECDDLLAELIERGKIKKELIKEDPGIYKFSKKLEEAVNS